MLIFVVGCFQKKNEQKVKAQQKYDDWLKDVRQKQIKDHKQKEKLEKVLLFTSCSCRCPRVCFASLFS